MKILVNSDFHEFQFAGPAQDLIDNVSFAAGQGKLTEFPDEPESDSFRLLDRAWPHGAGVAGGHSRTLLYTYVG